MVFSIGPCTNTGLGRNPQQKHTWGREWKWIKSEIGHFMFHNSCKSWRLQGPSVSVIPDDQINPCRQAKGKGEAYRRVICESYFWVFRNKTHRFESDNFWEQHIPFPSSVSSPALHVAQFANSLGWSLWDNLVFSCREVQHKESGTPDCVEPLEIIIPLGY